MTGTCLPLEATRHGGESNRAAVRLPFGYCWRPCAAWLFRSSSSRRSSSPSPLRPSCGRSTGAQARSGAARARRDVVVPTAHARGRITVLVRLAQPPLAQWTGRSLRPGPRPPPRRGPAPPRAPISPASRARSRRRPPQLRRAIPEARCQRRYRVVLNGLAVELPAAKLPATRPPGLRDQGLPEPPLPPRARPSPSLIGRRHLGGDGLPRRGDQDRRGRRRDRPGERLLRPGRLHLPAGFPKGGTQLDDAEGDRRARVPRARLGPARPPRRRPRASFHGTHVAGIAAGGAGTYGAGGATTRARRALGRRAASVARQLPRLQRADADRLRGEHAGDRRRLRIRSRGRMDVINFSGGGSETEPVNDAMIETVATSPPPASSRSSPRATTATTSVSARRVSGHGAGGDLRRRRLEHQVFAPSLEVVDPAALAGRSRSVPPRARASGVVDGSSASPPATSGRRRPVPAAGPSRTRTTGEPAPGRVARRRRRDRARGASARSRRRRARRRAGAAGIVFVDNRPGEANTVPIAAGPARAAWSPTWTARP